jgi:opacity protein-like surface antigen
MKSNFVAAAVVAVAALTSVTASAQPLNSFLFEQLQAPSTKTRAEVKSEVVQAQNAGATSSFNGVTAQQNLAAPRAEKAGAAPQAAAELVKTTTAQ